MDGSARDPAQVARAHVVSWLAREVTVERAKTPTWHRQRR